MRTESTMVRVASLLLVLCLLPLNALAQSGGVLEKANKPDYESALQELRSANLGDIERLEVVRNKLEGVGFHLFSVQYRLFVEALLVLAREEKQQYDKALENVRGLGNIVKFVQEYSQQPNFPDLSDLAEYIRARMLEANKDYSGAIRIYRKYPGVLDSLIRASDLSDKVTPTPTLKPTPTSTLVPTLPPPASISVSVIPGAAIVRWSTLSGAKEYRVYRMDMASGIPSGLIATVTGTEHRDATVEAGHTYRYQVAAISGTRASGLTAYAEAVMPSPTLKPTPKPTPTSTIKPTPKLTPTPTSKLASTVKTKSDFYLFPDSNRRRLTYEEVWTWQYDALGYAMNELFARYGRPFEPGGKYDNYFRCQAWYMPRPDEYPRLSNGMPDDEPLLNLIEWENYTLIKRVREEMRAAGTTNPDGKPLPLVSGD